MSRVKNLQKENLKPKGEISAVNSELQKLKLIIEQQGLQADFKQVGDAATRNGNSIQKSVDFLYEDHHITKNFQENISKELTVWMPPLMTYRSTAFSITLKLLAFLNRMSMSPLKPPHSCV